MTGVTGTVVGIVVVGATVVVGTVVVTGTVFANMPTRGSLGTAKLTVHVAGFTKKGVIALHVPFL